MNPDLTLTNSAQWEMMRGVCTYEIQNYDVSEGMLKYEFRYDIVKQTPGMMGETVGTIVVNMEGVSCSACETYDMSELCPICQDFITRAETEIIVTNLVRNVGAPITIHLPLFHASNEVPEAINAEVTLARIPANVDSEEGTPIRETSVPDVLGIYMSSHLRLDCSYANRTSAGKTVYLLGTITKYDTLDTLMAKLSQSSMDIYNMFCTDKRTVTAKLTSSCKSRNHNRLRNEQRTKSIENWKQFAMLFFAGKCEFCYVIDYATDVDVPF